MIFFFYGYVDYYFQCRNHVNKDNYNNDNKNSPCKAILNYILLVVRL